MAWKTHIVTPHDIAFIMANAPVLVDWVQNKEREPGICGEIDMQMHLGHLIISRWWKNKEDAETVIELFKSENIELLDATFTEIPDPQ